MLQTIFLCLALIIVIMGVVNAIGQADKITRDDDQYYDDRLNGSANE